MRAPFGTMPDGQVVECVTLRLGHVRATIITLGATLQALETPDRHGEMDDIVLGHDDLQGYIDHRGFFGATIGRVANRIAAARFDLNGRTVQLPANEGPNMLHGGADGFDRRVWHIETADDDHVRMSLVSPDGDQGFPGQVRAYADYRLMAGDEGVALRIQYEATTDAPTPLVMTNHSFFALAGAKGLAARPYSALDYRLTAQAARYLPVDAALIPLAPASVTATPFDFRTGRQPVTAVRAHAISGYDHTLCLDSGELELSDRVTGRIMRMTTNQPGVQLYTGNFLNGSVVGKQGRAYARHDGMCLEPQSWPNAVNMPPVWGGGDVVLQPQATYRNTLTLRFPPPQP